MNNLQLDCEHLKKLYNKLMDKYEIALVRDFECDYNKCEEIDNFFLSTYESVISKLCYKYQDFLCHLLVEVLLYLSPDRQPLPHLLLDLM